MFETFGFEETTAREVSVLFALGLGVLFGALAQVTRFCFRRAVVGEDRKQAAGIWFLALAVAVLGTQGAVHAGWISFDEHRLLSSELPILAITAGGLLFGVGMVLTPWLYLTPDGVERRRKPARTDLCRHFRYRRPRHAQGCSGALCRQPAAGEPRTGRGHLLRRPARRCAAVERLAGPYRAHHRAKVRQLPCPAFGRGANRRSGSAGLDRHRLCAFRRIRPHRDGEPVLHPTRR